MSCLLRPLFLLIALLAGSAADAAVKRWDSLPALDVQQWQGPYSGQTVCPMCRHGYDAGVLLVLPGTAPAARVAATLAQLHGATQDVDDPRFRVFVVTIDAPDAQLRAALLQAPAHWFLGTLVDDDRGAARAAFGSALERSGSGHVFAQRRSLRQFEPLTDLAASSLAADVEWAREVLRHAYAEPAATEHPDTPRGLLWSAPSRPETQVVLAANSAQRQLCFARGAESALLGLRIADSDARPHWARTDARGCLPLRPAEHAIEIELFPWRASPIRIRRSAPAPGDDPIVIEPELAHITGVDGSERVVGGRCEGCEAVFTALPDRLPSIARLGAHDAAGEPLSIHGRVLDAAGAPRPGIVVYAYQTDAAGHYPPAPELGGAASRHGRLRGWALSDENGLYGFATVRPASYPDSSVEQHVHMHVIEPGRCTYYLGDLLFDDDPKLGSRQRERARDAHGGNGVVRPSGDPSGWTVRRNIQLGLNVSDYDDCGARAAWRIARAQLRTKHLLSR
jgi:protocatechuate 3,4-dioxygenase beta subunit